MSWSEIVPETAKVLGKTIATFYIGGSGRVWRIYLKQKTTQATKELIKVSKLQKNIADKTLDEWIGIDDNVPITHRMIDEIIDFMLIPATVPDDDDSDDIDSDECLRNL